MIVRKWGDTIAIPRNDSLAMYSIVRCRIVQQYKRLRRHGLDHEDAKDAIWEVMFAMWLVTESNTVMFKSKFLEAR